jgi:quercetin dioxygenase-like cupin family protein
VDAFVWDAEPVEPLNDKIGRQMVNGEAMTLARIMLASGAIVPEHSHENEQIATVVVGRLRFQLGNEEAIVAAGESVVIPGNVPHRVEALEDSVVFDVFAPRREDWIRGDDAYLRG